MLHLELTFVLGITLHIEKSGSSAAYDLVFHKAESSVVQIGRRPGTENDKPDPGKAMFRCPVVSRRHAKFTFTDAGSVCALFTYICPFHLC